VIIGEYFADNLKIYFLVLVKPNTAFIFSDSFPRIDAYFWKKLLPISLNQRAGFLM